ncbi:transposase [Ensifer sp. WSM1721]|uniref:transposase n=1 Tax=Ensifer sp. WSM1721 TaxID=1041159 RepID=UPI003524BFDC
MEPGASVSAIAHRIGLRPSQLFAWRRDALDHALLAAFGLRCFRSRSTRSLPSRCNDRCCRKKGSFHAFALDFLFPPT